MGITTIVNLNPLPNARPVDRSVDPPAMERVEQTTRIADATYSPHGSKASRGSESDDSDEDSDEDDLEVMDDGGDPVVTVKRADESPKRQIDFVA